MGLDAEHLAVGKYSLDALLDTGYLEYQRFDEELGCASRVGTGLEDATIEILSVSDTCVTGRFAGLERAGGPALDGGFRAPRCTP